MSCCCGYVSAEIVGHSLILTKPNGDTVDINLCVASVWKHGDNFYVSSMTTKSSCIPLDNDLLDGSPLDYDDLQEFVSSIPPCWGGGGGGPDPEEGPFLLLEDGDYVLLEDGDRILLEG